jgi:hypothetical protein
MPSRCKQCDQPLVEIDHWGERLTGCPECVTAGRPRLAIKGFKIGVLFVG